MVELAAGVGPAIPGRLERSRRLYEEAAGVVPAGVTRPRRRSAAAALNNRGRPASQCVLNAPAGSPAPFTRFGSAAVCQTNRTTAWQGRAFVG